MYEKVYMRWYKMFWALKVAIFEPLNNFHYIKMFGGEVECKEFFFGELQEANGLRQKEATLLLWRSGAYDNLFVGQSSTDLQDSNDELMNQIWTNTSL